MRLGLVAASIIGGGDRADSGTPFPANTLMIVARVFNASAVRCCTAIISLPSTCSPTNPLRWLCASVCALCASRDTEMPKLLHTTNTGNFHTRDVRFVNPFPMLRHRHATAPRFLCDTSAHKRHPRRARVDCQRNAVEVFAICKTITAFIAAPKRQYLRRFHAALNQCLNHGNNTSVRKALPRQQTPLLSARGRRST